MWATSNALDERIGMQEWESKVRRETTHDFRRVSFLSSLFFRIPPLTTLESPPFSTPPHQLTTTLPSEQATPRQTDKEKGPINISNDPIAIAIAFASNDPTSLTRRHEEPNADVSNDTKAQETDRPQVE
jgi:hypothetical protein